MPAGSYVNIAQSTRSMKVCSFGCPQEALITTEWPLELAFAPLSPRAQDMDCIMNAIPHEGSLTYSKT